MVESCWQAQLHTLGGRKKTDQGKIESVCCKGGKNREEQEGKTKIKADNLGGSLVVKTSERKANPIYDQTKQRGGGDDNTASAPRGGPGRPCITSIFDFSTPEETSSHSAVQTGICLASGVTPVADPGTQHDLPLPSGHAAALAHESPPPLCRPGLHLAAGGGRRGRPAEVPASLPGEQPPPLGQYKQTDHVCCLLRSVLYFWEAQVLPVLLNNPADVGLRINDLSLFGEMLGVTVVGLIESGMGSGVESVWSGERTD